MGFGTGLTGFTGKCCRRVFDWGGDISIMFFELIVCYNIDRVRRVVVCVGGRASKLGEKGCF